jgi:hypothetical protein
MAIATRFLLGAMNGFLAPVKVLSFIQEAILYKKIKEIFVTTS